jgi:hypothetical protein
VSGREEHPSDPHLSFDDTANMESSSSHLSANARAFLVDALIGHTGIGQTAKCDKSKSAKTISQNGNAGQLSVELMCRDLWKEFHTLGTEMIITKAGRRMFPSLKVRLSGLLEDVHYLVYLDIDPVDDKRYRYVYHR